MTYSLKRRNLEPKKWRLFDIVGLYSSGVKITLKVGLVPMETTLQIHSTSMDTSNLLNVGNHQILYDRA